MIHTQALCMTLSIANNIEVHEVFALGSISRFLDVLFASDLKIFLLA